jgi:hypothetical protein
MNAMLSFLILFFLLIAEASAQDKIEAAKDKSLPHPWLNTAPGGILRLIEKGNVRIEVDEAAVHAAKRTALTSFEFFLSYLMRYQHRTQPKNPDGSETVELAVRFTDFDWRIEHRIMLSENYLPAKPWESALLLHEFDHVAISTDPRLAAIFDSFQGSKALLKVELSAGESLSRARIDDEVSNYVARFRKSIEDLVGENYKRLDAESNDGLRSIGDRRKFFAELYSNDRLQGEKFEFGDVVEKQIVKEKPIQIEQHYTFR